MALHLEIRSQHSVGKNANGFGGPDTYVAVQVVPSGVRRLVSLQGPAAQRRGIKLVYFGEGYSEHRGPRSMLGQAIAAAEQYIAEQQRASGTPA